MAISAELTKAFERLHTIFGTHAKAAEFLDISSPHYRGIRNGSRNITKIMREHILSKTKKTYDKDFSPKGTEKKSCQES